MEIKIALEAQGFFFFVKEKKYILKMDYIKFIIGQRVNE